MKTLRALACLAADYVATAVDYLRHERSCAIRGDWRSRHRSFPCTCKCGDAGPECDGRYVDYQGAERDCTPGGEGCGLHGCPGVHSPTGGW